MRFEDACNVANHAWTRVFNWLFAARDEANLYNSFEALTKVDDMAMAIGVTTSPDPTGFKVAIRASQDGVRSLGVYNEIWKLAKGAVDYKVVNYQAGTPEPAGYQERTRPLVAGHSIGHHKITAGTLGAFVTKNGWGGKILALSNNHVLANSNDAKKGDAILQPGRHDGGVTPDDVVGKLSDFQVIKSSGNVMDAAVAFIDKRFRPSNVAIPKIGRVTNNVVEPKTRIKVQKSGRTTGHQVGIVNAVGLRGVRVNYGQGKVWSFDDCIEVVGAHGQEFSAGGDSGSLVVDMDGNPVGLLFAGSPGHTIINPIAPILKRFDVKFVS